MPKRIAADKWRHFYVGILMGAVLQTAALWFLHNSFYLATLVALFCVLAISYGFELFSKISGKGVYELADALASIIGGVTGMILAILVLILIG